ncbi:MAG: DUF998 domain-containing protein [Candidatus Izemoplasmataceae bacterium]
MHISNRKFIFYLLAIIALTAYFLHVWIGTILYEGYNPLSQAISDLTAEDSPVKHITRVFSNLYGFLSVIVVGAFIFYSRKYPSKLLRVGILLLSLMIMISAVGYALFPLSESGYAGTFKDIMHMVITGFVVGLTLMALILLFIAFKNSIYKIVTLIALTLLIASPILMTFCSPDYFGVIERISVYTVVLYFGFLATVILYKK